MIRIPAIAFICLLAVISAYSHGKTGDYTIDKKGVGTFQAYSGNISVQIVYDQPADSYLITVTAKAKGWVAVGFGAVRQMKDAEIVMGYVNNGTGYISRQFGTGSVTHSAVADSTNAAVYTLVSASETNGITSITVKRPLQAEGYGLKKLKRGQNITMIYAWSDGDNFESIHKEKDFVTSIRLP